MTTYEMTKCCSVVLAILAAGSAQAQWLHDPLAAPPNACSDLETETCEEIEGGKALTVMLTAGECEGPFCLLTPTCVCDVLVGDSPRIVNARRGDVGLVPMDGSVTTGSRPGGNATVRAVMSGLGQWHRHAVIYSDDGTELTHATTYWEVDPARDVDYWNRRLQEYVLEHSAHVGDPASFQRRQTLTAALSESDLARSRFDRSGLVLKPIDETERPRFEAAATRADANTGWYRISDYTTLGGMSFPSTGAHRRGTQCAGFVQFAFEPEYPTMKTVFYDFATRVVAGEELFDQVRASVTGLGVLIRNRVANQVANCFAGWGCADTSDRWRTDPSTGATVSPDNLLPFNFTMESPAMATPAGGTDEVNLGSAGFRFRQSRVNPDVTLVRDNNGNVATPFQRIEPQVFAPASVTVVRLTRW